tara:strand:- start:309 stop:704 length:396 start_codon:yes stop_codon:yes gene_type:complete
MNPIADAYINEEFPLNLFESWDVVTRLFESIEEKTDEDSQEMYDKLPSVVMVYRGVLAKDELKAETGVSWTTNYKVAEMFALRFKPLGGTPYIMKGEVNKEDILYFTNARQESEALINADDMLWVDIDEVE